MFMDEKKQLAIDLAKALIQNNNVRPVFSDREEISYVLDNTKYSFTTIVSQFMDKIERIEKW